MCLCVFRYKTDLSEKCFVKEKTAEIPVFNIFTSFFSVARLLNQSFYIQTVQFCVLLQLYLVLGKYFKAVCVEAEESGQAQTCAHYYLCIAHAECRSCHFVLSKANH